MRRYSLTARRMVLATAATFVASLVLTVSGAQAVVVDMNPAAAGQATVTYPTDQGDYYGVALTPSLVSGDIWEPGTETGVLGTAGIPTVTTEGACTDPLLQAPLSLPSGGLCSHGWAAGSVLNKNETFALVWDPNPYNDYTAPYVEQFLRDVADGSNTLTSPYAVTTQYSDPEGPAGNVSKYGGGYDDATGYPTSGCAPANPGQWGPWYFQDQADIYTTGQNQVCLTDAQLRTELQAMVRQNDLEGSKIQPGYSPVLVLLTPPGVETCIDGSRKLCSANSDSSSVPAQFCSYHSQITIDGTVYEYIVQPFVAMTACDEPGSPQVPDPFTPPQLETDMGARLVSPLSQAQIATITNPGFNGWFALNGDEINDNGCAPEATGASGSYASIDQATVGGSSQNPYLLQREFNNGGEIENTPWADLCTPSVDVGVNFVVPSAVDAGDVVQFDGSKSYSSLLIPDANFRWNFGDGTTATGPSATHIYPNGGSFTVTLTITDRGGDTDQLSQTIQVLGSNGLPAAAPAGPGAGSASPSALSVRLLLMPQSLKKVLRSGIAVRVTSNKAADGIATVSITRAAAKRAHLKVGKGPTVRIGIGTVSSVTDGTVTLRLHLSPSIDKRLSHLRHLDLTVRLALVAAGNQQLAIDAAGQY
jgi:PKD domain